MGEFTAAGVSNGGKADDALHNKNTADAKLLYAELQQLMIDYKNETKPSQQAVGTTAQI